MLWQQFVNLSQQPYLLDTNSMNISLIDSHCHLDFPEFDHDRAQVLQRCRQRGVDSLILAATCRQHWPRLWQLVDCSASPRLYGSLGLHPYFLHLHQHADLAELRRQLQLLRGNSGLCAIGEIGLDYQLTQPDRQQQQFYLLHQLQLAREFDLPVILHVRKAHADMLAILKQQQLARAGVVHAFNGSLEQAREYIKLGFMLGIGGAYTWPQARKLRRMLPQLPLDSLVLETDSPDMPPVFAAGQRNQPDNLPEIAAIIAELHQVELTKLACRTSANCRRIFNLPPAGVK